MQQLDLFTREDSKDKPSLTVPHFETPEELESFLSRLKVVEVGVLYLGDKIKKRPISANYQGLCPFHQERTASFYLKPHKNSFVCYGCGVRGGPLSLDFRLGAEICTSIVEKAGIESILYLIQPHLASDVDQMQKRYIEVISETFAREEYYF